MTDLKPFLPQVIRDIRELGHPFALVGGLAVSTRAEERLTKDIDFAVAVQDEASAKSLVRRLLTTKNYQPGEAFLDARSGELRGARVLPPGLDADTAPVDLLFSTCGIEREVAAAAPVVDLLPDTSVNVATCGHLIAMKTLSNDDARRLKDRVDLASLFKVATGWDLAQAQDAVELMQKRGYGFPLGKDDLGAELEQARQLYAPSLRPDRTLHATGHEQANRVTTVTSDSGSPMDNKWPAIVRRSLPNGKQCSLMADNPGQASRFRTAQISAEFLEEVERRGSSVGIPVDRKALFEANTPQLTIDQNAIQRDRKLTRKLDYDI